MNETDVDRGRRYGGLELSERTRRRRAALLEAGQTLFGTQGYRATSVGQLCAEAGLTKRYFYESFTDREAALGAVYDELVGGLRGATLDAIARREPSESLAEAALTAFVGYLTADRRRARIVLIEVVGVSPEMETRRYAVLSEFAELVAEMWLGGDETTPLRQHTAVALVGGVNHLLVDWLLGGETQEPDELVRACTTLFAGARDQLTGRAG